MGESMSDKHVVREVIGPGPDAEHARHTFKPDAEWQWREIARLFTDSRGFTTYIGDWHTHPNARGASLSNLDLRAMAEVLSNPRSGTRTIITVILCEGRSTWSWAAWVGSLTSGFDGRKSMAIERADVMLSHSTSSA